MPMPRKADKFRKRIAITRAVSLPQQLDDRLEAAREHGEPRSMQYQRLLALALDAETAAKEDTSC